MSEELTKTATALAQQSQKMSLRVHEQREKQEWIQKQLEIYCAINAEKIAAFNKQNPGKLPPIYWVEEAGAVLWLNRRYMRRNKIAPRR